MKLDLGDKLDPRNPHSNLRQSKSYDADLASRTSDWSLNSPPNLRVRSTDPIEKAGLQEYHENDDMSPNPRSSEHIQMTFEPAHCSSSPTATHPKETSINDRDHGTKELATLERPMLKSSITLPAYLSSAMEHNAWLDDDDYEFSGEKEMTMSFE
jgi:hypothetical protein